MSPLSSSFPTPLPTRPTSPTPLNPRHITSSSQIATQLALLSTKEQSLTLSLNSLISDRTHLDGALVHLQQLGSEVGRLAIEVDGGGVLGLSRHGGDVFEDDGYGLESEGLVERVRRVWETSERVGGKVRSLDEEVGRIREATDIVTEVLELKNSLQTLTSAIAKSDWESASRACRRAMSVRQEVIEGGFAGVVVPTPQQPQPPPQLLAELRDILLQTFRTEFDEAAIRKDEQAVSRFFRLWPGIGAEEEGLEAYGDFVVGLVKGRSSNAGKPSNPLYYITSLTGLLESIAHIIDQHQPVVEKYYGDGRMRTVVGRLVGESDRVVRGLVEGWEEERRVGRLISETKQSRFLLLSNPQLLPSLFPSLQTQTPNQLSLSSLATSTTSHLPTLTNLPNLSTASNLLQSYARPGGLSATPTPQSHSNSMVNVMEEEQGPDARDVDRVLGELVALGGRWALFRRFVFGRLVEDGEQEDGIDGEAEVRELKEKGRANGNMSVEGKEMDVVEHSGSQRAIENLLKVYYEPLELWFLRTSIEKAHRLDSPETSFKPHLSSILDDTFYLLKQVLSRTLSCGSLKTLRLLRVKIGEVVESDYAGILKRKMEGVYAASTGGEKGLEKEKRERDMRGAFIIYLNDLDVSADYMERLVEETLRSLPQVFTEPELPAVREELELLKNLSSYFRSICKSGLEQLFNQLTRPRLRGLLDDVYRDLTYALDEDEFAEAEEGDLVRKRFIRSWEGLVDGYRDAFTDHNYQNFFSMTIEVLVRPWEKMIMSMRISELGAIRYDRDVRNVANYLSTQTNFGGAREKFTRLQQIGTVLNMDSEEDPEEFWSNSGIPWRISKGEFNTIIEQRI